MAYHYVEPEVAGEIGENSVLDTSVHPPIVSRLNYEITGWGGDSILESFPCFIVTTDLADAIAAAGLTGATFDEVEVTVLPEVAAMMERAFPSWKWMKLTGEPGVTDLGYSDDYRLVVSDNALAILQRYGMAHAEIEPQ